MKYRWFWARRGYCSYKSQKWKKPVGHTTKLQVYNRLANDVVNVVTLRKEMLTWYCCGPTVYDSPHLGHACCYLQFDIMRRIIENYHNLNVVTLMSVTDVDDKIIKRSNDEGVHFKELAKKYEDEFFHVMNRLNVIPPNLALRVSEHIDDIVSFVETIIEKGYGYKAEDGSVYFSVDKYTNYGKLVPVQSRCETTGKKINLDFALWKASKPGEPYWQSPWGKGRPGWHIECSAMASKYIGSTIDFHSGGIDLLFPHHENEEAQSCAYHGCDQWVNYWLHSGHLHLRNDVKMSKSLKNTVSVTTFLDKYSPDHLRMLCMLVPYRNGVEYSEEVMRNATSVFRKVINFTSQCDTYLNRVDPKCPIDDALLLQNLQAVREKVVQYLSSDFNTSSAMLEVLTLMSCTLNEMKVEKVEVTQSSSIAILAVSNFVTNFFVRLGFFAENEISNSSVLTEKVLRSSLDLRTSVRGIAISKSFQGDLENKKALLSACDDFRTDLKKIGVEIKDGKGSSTWTLGEAKEA